MFFLIIDLIKKKKKKMDYFIDTTRILCPQEREPFPLIHMTQTWEVLKKILSEGFRPSYCEETISNDTESKLACFPMISVSNVTMDFAISYQKSYGTLGVVLTKEWGEENGFNPVLYLEKKSDLTNDIVSNFKHIVGPSKDELRRIVNYTYEDTREYLTRQQIKIFAYSKNYDGDLVRNKILVSKKYPFGMEREWRRIIKDEMVPYFLVGDEEISKKKEYNQLIEGLRIDFKIEHLKGIIIETEWQLNEVKEIVCKKFNLKDFPKNIEIRINTSRHVPDEG